MGEGIFDQTLRAEQRLAERILRHEEALGSRSVGNEWLKDPAGGSSDLCGRTLTIPSLYHQQVVENPTQPCNRSAFTTGTYNGL